MLLGVRPHWDGTSIGICRGPVRSSSRARVCRSTKDIIVPDRIFDALTTELKFFVGGDSVETVQELLIEAAVACRSRYISHGIPLPHQSRYSWQSEQFFPWPVDRAEVRPVFILSRS